MEYTIAKNNVVVRAISKLISSQGVGKDGNTICSLGTAVDLTEAECLDFCKKRKWVYKPYTRVYHATISLKDKFEEGFVVKNHKFLRKLKPKDFERFKK